MILDIDLDYDEKPRPLGHYPSELFLLLHRCMLLATTLPEAAKRNTYLRQKFVRVLGLVHSPLVLVQNQVCVCEEIQDTSSLHVSLGPLLSHVF